MPITNVGSTWRAGNLAFVRSGSTDKGRIDFDGVGHKITVRDLAADTTLIAEDSGFTYICDNSTGTITVTLPSVASTGFASTAPSTDRGLYYTFINGNTTGAQLSIIASSTQFINGLGSSTPFAMTVKYGRATVVQSGVTTKGWLATVDPVTT